METYYIKTSVLQFHPDTDLLWKSHAPEKILRILKCSQLADSIRTWYFYREKASQDLVGKKFSDIGICQYLWFNRHVRSRSKQYLYYGEWYNKKICTINDLLNPPHPGSKLFEELILDFGISLKDRRKFNFMMKNIPLHWIQDPCEEHIDIHDVIVIDLLNSKKVSSYAYNILLDRNTPDKRYTYWEHNINCPNEVEWEEVHTRNFNSCIVTRLRSFYFKLFHNAIALNKFLYMIKKRDSPCCSFCDKEEETLIHLFCNCDLVKPLWNKLLNVIRLHHNPTFNPSIFEKMFGISKDKFLSFIFLCLKYYIYVCKFQGKHPSFDAFKSFTKSQKDTEYYIAKKKGKLTIHFKKWRFDF